MLALPLCPWLEPLHLRPHLELPDSGVIMGIARKLGVDIRPGAVQLPYQSVKGVGREAKESKAVLHGGGSSGRGGHALPATPLILIPALIGVCVQGIEQLGKGKGLGKGQGKIHHKADMSHVRCSCLSAYIE